MRRCFWLGSLAIALLCLAVTTMLGCRALHSKLPEWVVYNTRNSGLPHDDGYIITFDAQGNAWRGTEGGGAARTDGRGDWLVYNRSNSGLPKNDIESITFDSKGNTWMGTFGGGVARFDGAEGWTVYNIWNSMLPDNMVSALTSDKNGNIWMGTHRGGLVKFDGEEHWTVYNTSNSGIPGDMVNAVTTDARGNVWMSCPGAGVAKFDGVEKWTVYNRTNSGLPGHDLAYWGLSFDPEGNLWIGTEGNGAVKFDGADEWTVYNISNSGLPSDFVHDFAFDDQGNIWMATQGGGVAKFDGVEEWTVYNTLNSGLPYNNIVSVTVDADGNLWIGTGKAHALSTGGVAVYREGGVVPYGLSAEFNSLISATTTLGVTRTGQPTPLRVNVEFDVPLEAGKTLWIDLSPLGPDLQLEHVGEGLYSVSTTVTTHRNAQYKLPVQVQTDEGVRSRFFLATLDLYPVGDLVVYDDVPGDGWTVEGAIDKSDLASTAFIRTGQYSHMIGPGMAKVWYVCDDPEGIDLFGYSHLEFYVNGGMGSGQDPMVAKKRLSELGIVPEADTWKQVTIPVSDLTSPMKSIYIWGLVENPLYIDDMRLVAGKPNTKKSLKQLLHKIPLLLRRKDAT